jgi:5-methylcytosine-specific restriction endonuclease McrA
MSAGVVFKNWFYQSTEWKSLRLKALQRDGFRCRHCGVSLSGKGRSRVDHIIPRKQQPSLALEISNLQCLCPSCDNKRHNEKGAYRRQGGADANNYQRLLIGRLNTSGEILDKSRQHKLDPIDQLANRILNKTKGN